ncbi:MAG: YhcG family protein [Rickettsia sp.]|uniref:PDDEXK nuclease domain-containing protein n=1 Tax=Rickettsia sp. TaxID=789 RepID=UPI0039781ED8
MVIKQYSASDGTSINIQGYAEFLEQLKDRVAKSRYRAARAVNTELITLYHYIGTEILDRQKRYGWGSKVIDKLSKDLRAEFQNLKGFSPQNLKYMKRFAEIYTFDEIGQQLVNRLPWGHNIILMYMISDKQKRQWYIQKSLEYNWSRNILSMQIETNLYEREGKAITNFNDRLPSPQSDLAQQTLRNPYVFDFLSLSNEAHEREIENALITHIEKFLLQLGEGFAFLGRQYPIQIGTEDFYIDLLFYHIKLRSFIVVELKAGKFKAEYVGKMNFYLSAVDDTLKHPTDNPSIGLILCRDKGERIKVEYALRDMSKPIGLAEYRFTEALPENIRTLLPTIEELEEELSKDLKIKETKNED